MLQFNLKPKPTTYIFAIILSMILIISSTLTGVTPGVEARGLDSPVLDGSDPRDPNGEPTPPPPDDLEGQIVGGNNSDPGEYPWQVFLEAYPNDEYFYYDQFCGGSLIDEYWVLTAAHCITNDNGGLISINNFRVIAGGYQFDTTPCCSGDDANYYQARGVVKIVRHPNYNPNTYNNDIALLKLNAPVTLNNSGTYGATAIVPLATPGMGNFAGETAVVTGWGKNGENQNYLNRRSTLQEVSVPVVSNTTCNNKYGGGVTSNMLCAGDLNNGGEDSCQGDSGGPLVIYRNGQYYQAGVVSFGYGCARTNYPGIYTRVSNFKGWIDNQIAPPVVKSVVRVNSNPSKANSVSFKITFSKSVTGVDLSDFDLTTTGVVGATLGSISGSGATRTVTVNTGTGNGTIELEVLDDDTIKDGNLTPLGGAGGGNGYFNSGQIYTMAKITTIVTYYSNGPYDGWVLESGENSNKGGSRNAGNTTILIGDNASKKQYRGVLHFNMGDSPIDPSALFYKVKMYIKRQGIVGGTNPFSIFGKYLFVDLNNIAFGSSVNLENSDFQAAASKSQIAKFTSKNSNGWYSTVIGSANYGYISRDGVNQFRLRFKNDDNNDFLANYLKIYSGNASVSIKPKLVIEYYFLP